MTKVLGVESLHVRFGGVHAVDDVGLVVDEGELVGLIGPNGAGKTTLLDAVGGFVGATGTIRLNDHPLDPLPPHQRALRGLGRTWQTVELFHDLSVAENVQVGAQCHAATEEALDRLRLTHLATRMPDDLSHGERKLVGVARAIAASPRVLCMDEPAAGLDATAGAELGADLRDLAATGVAVLLIDHDMGLILGTCDRVYVMEFGRVIAEGTPASIRSDGRVVEAYLGQRQGLRP